VLEHVFAFFVTGLLATLSPCVLPLYPGLLVYLGGQAQDRKRVSGLLGLFVLLGVLTMMLLLGVVIASLRVAVGQVLTVLVPLAYLVIIALGAAMLLGVSPFSRARQLHVPLLGGPLASAYVYGLLYGPVALPCSGPFVVSIFVYSLTVADYLSQLILFLAFGLGLGLPLVILSFLAQVHQNWLVRGLGRHHRWVNRIGGLLLIGVGLWGLGESWEFVALYL